MVHTSINVWLKKFLQTQYERYKKCFITVLFFIQQGLFCIAISSFCMVMPAQSSGLFSSVGLKEELELGKRFNTMVRSQMPLIEDPEVTTYVQSLVDRLVAAMPPQPFPFKVSIILNNDVNAFAIPGGYVFVNTGLIMSMEHESELVGALAHELAHVTQRHIAHRMERSQLITTATMLGALASVFLGGGQGTGAAFAGSLAAGQAAMLNYSRADETEADQIGLQYAVKAGFRAQGMEEAFEKIRRKQWASASSAPEYLSTHPSIGERINEIHTRVATLPKDVQKRKESDTRFNRVRTLIWARYGEPETAYWMFSKADKKDCLSLMGLAILAERRSRIKEAENLFQKALNCSPKDALIWREAGSFYYNKGSDTEALQALQKSLSLDSKDLITQFFYARILDDSGNSAKAEQYYKGLLKALPEDPEIHFVYGRSLGKSGKTFEAYIHLAYSALYQNDQVKYNSWLEKARALVKTKEQEVLIDNLTKTYTERSENL